MLMVYAHFHAIIYFILSVTVDTHVRLLEVIRRNATCSNVIEKIQSLCKKWIQSKC